MSLYQPQGGLCFDQIMLSMKSMQGGYPLSLDKKATIHHLITSKNVLFPGHNHLLTTAADDSSLLIITGAWVIIKVLGHQHWWLAGDYDLEIGHF